MFERRLNATTAQRPATPWTPFQDLLGFDPFQNIRSSRAYEYDVTRTENGYEVEVPVPGYKPADIDVTVKDGLIAVSGKVDQDQIDAHVVDGMLLLNLHRRPEAQPKRIPIT